MRHSLEYAGGLRISSYRTQSASSWLNWLQIGILLALLELALWSRGTPQHLFSVAALLWVIGTSIFPGRSASYLGLTSRGFRRSAWVISSSAVIAAVLVWTAWMF